MLSFSLLRAITSRGTEGAVDLKDSQVRLSQTDKSCPAFIISSRQKSTYDLDNDGNESPHRNARTSTVRPCRSILEALTCTAAQGKKCQGSCPVFEIRFSVSAKSKCRGLYRLLLLAKTINLDKNSPNKEKRRCTNLKDFDH